MAFIVESISRFVVQRKASKKELDLRLPEDIILEIAVALDATSPHDALNMAVTVGHASKGCTL